MIKFYNSNITKREREVLLLVIRGYSNSMIAQELVISVSTVKAHLESIYRKLNVHNKIQASVKAICDSIVSLEDEN